MCVQEINLECTLKNMNSIYRNDINLNYISMHSKHIQGTSTAMSANSDSVFNFIHEV